MAVGLVADRAGGKVPRRILNLARVLARHDRRPVAIVVIHADARVGRACVAVAPIAFAVQTDDVGVVPACSVLAGDKLPRRLIPVEPPGTVRRDDHVAAHPGHVRAGHRARVGLALAAPLRQRLAARESLRRSGVDDIAPVKIVVGAVWLELGIEWLRLRRHHVRARIRERENVARDDRAGDTPRRPGSGRPKVHQDRAFGVPKEDIVDVRVVTPRVVQDGAVQSCANDVAKVGHARLAAIQINPPDQAAAPRACGLAVHANVLAIRRRAAHGIADVVPPHHGSRVPPRSWAVLARVAGAEHLHRAAVRRLAARVRDNCSQQPPTIRVGSIHIQSRPTVASTHC